MQVEIVSEDIAIANDLDPTNRTLWYERLGGAGVIFTPQCEVTVRSNTIAVRNIYSETEATRENIDLIIDWNGCISNHPLTQHPTLRHHSIGDCVSPRNVELAMAEAWDVATTL